MIDKTEIECRFRRSVDSYEDYATVQKSMIDMCELVCLLRRSGVSYDDYATVQ